jgi:hypothetical protein
MTTLQRLRSVRAILAAGILLRALAYGLAVAALVIAAGVLADMLVGLSLGTRTAIGGGAALTALVAIAAFAWRDRHVLSLERVALWIEEREPSLQFALVTAVDSGALALSTPAFAVDWTRLAWARAARAAAPAVASLGLGAAVLALLPSGAVGRVSAPRAGDSLERTPLGNRGSASRLTPLVADVVSPAYSGIARRSIDEPASIAALVGSTITLRGRGEATGISAALPTGDAKARSDADRWSITVAVGVKPIAARLSDDGRERIVAVEPIVDQPPAVVLHEPPRDTILRRAAGRIALRADAHDDYGLTTAGFEYIVSSGEGETFKFRSGILGAIQPSGTRASLSATLALDSLGLKPGDVVHLRAVARDANNVTGPGVGASETRVVRIARAGEYDSVAVEAAAPAEADKSVISQRMLITLAEALEKRRPTLQRPTVVQESRSIAADQTRLRKSVGEIIFSRLGGEPGGEESTTEDVPARARNMEELLRRADSATSVSVEALDFAGGESPVVAMNKPLLEAYNAMWDASTELEVGEPTRALPHMRRALVAIERARRAERIYLRGRPPQIVVDVSKARLQGKERGAPSSRLPRPAIDSTQRIREWRFARIVDMAGRGGAGTVDSLLLLRVESLAEAPSFAAALNDAIDALRRGDGARTSTALARARRALAGPATVRDSLGRWGGGVLP